MFDAAVIGGGLAGCMAAITLAKRNHRVVLFEAGSYPRAKVCGELLSPECVALFAHIGFLPHVQALNPTLIRTLRITSPDGSEWRSQFSAPAMGVSRYALDQALAAYAAKLGVEICEQTLVNTIDGNLADGFRLSAQTRAGSHEFSAASVIATYGKRSNLDRVLKRTFFKHQQPYLALKQHFRGTPLPEHIDLHVFQGGYCGISQVEEGRTNVCLLVQQSIFQQAVHGAQTNIDAFVQWMCTQNRYLGQWLSDAEPLYGEWLSIGQVPLCTKSAVENDVLFAGDAAGMIAPLAGDGMAMALHSGHVVAQSLDSFLTCQQDATNMKYAYARTWQRTFNTRLRLGRVLQSIMLRPRALSLGLHLLNQFPATGDWLVKHTRDMRLLENIT